MKFSIQLYSLRDLVSDGASFLALFPKLSAMGFGGVEFAGYHGLSAEEIRAALDAAGLVATGAHVSLDNFLPDQLPQTIEFHKKLGLRSIGVGWAPHSTADEAAASCAVLAAACKAAAAEGMVIYYHNHDGEFRPRADGSRAIEEFLAACPLELDCWWSYVAGEDTYKFITEHREGICHLHIKDGNLATRRPLALGEGENDLAAIVRGAQALGLEWLTLENDDPVPDGLSDAARSMAWLKANV